MKQSRLIAPITLRHALAANNKLRNHLRREWQLGVSFPQSPTLRSGSPTSSRSAK